MKSLHLTKFIKQYYNKVIFTPLFFILFFLFLLLKIEPCLIYQQQEPVFFLDSRFFNDFLNYPGGLIDYISAFLSQFYINSWIGAVIITLIAWFVSIATKGIIRLLNNRREVQIIHLFPAIILLALHSNYNHPLSFDIGLLLSLISVNIYLRLGKHKFLFRLTEFLINSIVLYYIANGLFFLFVVMCIIYELLIKRNYFCLVYTLISIIIPYLSATNLFIVNLSDAYTHIIKIESDDNRNLSYLLLGFYPVIFILFIIYYRFLSERIRQRIEDSELLKEKFRYPVQTILVFTLAVIVAVTSYDENSKTFLQVDYYARNKKWNDILRVVSPQSMNNIILICQFNRALYHTGRLSNEMFSYPQYAGVEGLILPRELGAAAPLLRSDIFFELGHVNEAQHWACEAIAVKGYTPSNLQRLVQTSILKGEYQIASKCINMLNKTLFYRDWAKHYQRYIKNKTLLNEDKELQGIYSLMPKTDFIVKAEFPIEELESLLKSNKSNKMAYEYLMAHYLLKRNVKKFISHLEDLSNYGYDKIPRHYEEALLAYLSQPKHEPVRLKNYKIDDKTIKDFEELLIILRSYRGNKKAAYSAIMARFGNTYWAYLLYS